MLCRLTNLSSAGRVVHDLNAVMRNIAAGASIDIDLKPEAAARYTKASEMGQKIKIEILEEGAAIIEGEAERSLDPQETFTLREGEFTAGTMKEPLSLKEARGAPGNAPPPALPPQETPASHPNPIQANAEKNAKPEEVVEEPKAEPATAAELIEAITAGALPQNDMVRLAETILKRKIGRANQNPAAIIKALSK